LIWLHTIIGLIGSRDTINSDIYDFYLKNINPEIKLFPREAQLFIYLVVLIFRI